MKNPEKFPERFPQTIIRTVMLAAVIAIVITLLHLFPAGQRSKFAQFGMIWLMAFGIVFGGHWLELLFINYLKFALPKNMPVLYMSRIVYWFFCAIPLLFIVNLIGGLFTYTAGLPGQWWALGLGYIGIELFMHALMQVRYQKSFYNGVY
jgi:hypothetical protein